MGVQSHSNDMLEGMRTATFCRAMTYTTYHERAAAAGLTMAKDKRRQPQGEPEKDADQKPELKENIVPRWPKPVPEGPDHLSRRSDWFKRRTSKAN